jgi:hypothetical protein
VAESKAVLEQASRLDGALEDAAAAVELAGGGLARHR